MNKTRAQSGIRSPSRSPYSARTYNPLPAFFGLSFGITWGIAALFWVFPKPLQAIFGPISQANPLFWLAVCAPNIAAIAVTARLEGWLGVRRLLWSLVRWRVGLGWYALVLALVPALGALGALLSGAVSLADARQGLMLPSMILSHVLSDPGPYGEELGWRGFALPRLLAGRSALAASLILGAVWGVWHLPAFLISGTPQSNAALAFPMFLLGAIVISVLEAWVYVNTRSVLLCALLHSTVNLMNMLGSPFAVSTGLLTVVAVIALVALGPKLSRKQASRGDLQLDPRTFVRART